MIGFLPVEFPSEDIDWNACFLAAFFLLNPVQRQSFCSWELLFLCILSVRQGLYIVCSIIKLSLLFMLLFFFVFSSKNSKILCSHGHQTIANTTGFYIYIYIWHSPDMI